MIVASISTATASPTPIILKSSALEGGEDREHEDHDHGGAGDRAGGALDAVRDGLVRAHARLSTPSRTRLRMNTW